MALQSPDNPIRILHLEDSELDHQLVRRTLQKSALPFECSRVETLPEFLSAYQDQAFDLILADYRLAGFTALDAWNQLPDIRAKPPFILLSGAIGESAAVEAIHCGIADFLAKQDMAALPRIILRVLAWHQAQQEKQQADAELARSEKRLAAFSQHLQSAIEQERAAIAREIHDDIGGSLAAVKLDLAWLSRHATEPSQHTHIASAVAMLQHAMDASRRIMLNLRPSILDQGIYAALQWLCTDFSKRTAIPLQLQSNTETIAAPKDIELTAYRTAQEALTNVLKYANATQVYVELSDAENVLTLEIRDNGKGFDPDAQNKPNAYGLRGLEERARIVGGWLDISARRGEGTSITLTIPLNSSPLTPQEEMA